MDPIDDCALSEAVDGRASDGRPTLAERVRGSPAPQTGGSGGPRSARSFARTSVEPAEAGRMISSVSARGGGSMPVRADGVACSPRAAWVRSPRGQSLGRSGVTTTGVVSDPIESDAEPTETVGERHTPAGEAAIHGRIATARSKTAARGTAVRVTTQSLRVGTRRSQHTPGGVSGSSTSRPGPSSSGPGTRPR